LLTGLLSTSTEDFSGSASTSCKSWPVSPTPMSCWTLPGSCRPGVTVRIPFQVAETDIESTVVSLTDIPAARLTLETPGGDVITPGTAAGVGSSFNDAGVRSYYRHTLPLPLPDAGAGTWQAVLELDEKPV